MPAPSSQLKAPSSLLTPGEQAVISVFVQLAQAMGMQRSLGEIYGLLYATPEALAFQDIVDRLGLSKGSVSQGLRFLRTVGAIKPVVVAGDRREFFEPVLELRALVGGFLKERLNPELESWGVRAKALKIEDFERAKSDELSAKSDEPRAMSHELTASGTRSLGLKAQSSELTAQKRRKLVQARIDKLKAWHKKANLVLPMVGKLLG
jgi:HTH-type transcriptional regulator, glycine betaine synthesis regulator